ncbi:MAG: polysaccharide biosynthesis/export family protein [Paracoccaceae bacterium]
MPYHPRRIFAACAIVFMFNTPLAAQTLPRMGLLPGETVMVDVYARPELTGERMIDAAGQIAIPLAGRIDAQGLTAPELESKIIESLRKSGLDQNPAVTVTATKRLDVYVDGAVSNPGAYPWRPGLTVAQVMALAGGRIAVSSDELGPAISALRSIEYAAAMERRAQSLALNESRILSEMAFTSAAYGTGGNAGVERAQFFTLPDRLAANPALADLIDTQRDVYRQKTDGRAQRYASLLDQQRLTAQRLDLLQQRQTEVTRETTIIADRLEAFQQLAEKKLVVAGDLVNLQRASSSANASLLDVIASIAETELALEQLRLDIDTFAVTAQGELATELSQVRADLLDVRARLDPALRAGMVGAAYDGAGAMTGMAGDKAGLLDGDTTEYAIIRVGFTAGDARTKGSPASLVMPGDTITVRSNIPE